MGENFYLMLIAMDVILLKAKKTVPAVSGLNRKMISFSQFQVSNLHYYKSLFTHSNVFCIHVRLHGYISGELGLVSQLLH